MKQSKRYTLLALLIPVLIVTAFNGPFSYGKKTTPVKVECGHICQWEHCPYKGVPMADRKEAIIEYTGASEGTDGYCIDDLHFQYPTEDYDQLEKRLYGK